MVGPASIYLTHQYIITRHWLNLQRLHLESPSDISCILQYQSSSLTLTTVENKKDSRTFFGRNKVTLDCYFKLAPRDRLKNLNSYALIYSKIAQAIA